MESSQDKPANDQQAPISAKKKKDFDYHIKIICVGDKNVGKTCLQNRFFNNRFQEQNISTLGVSQAIKYLTINDHKIKLQCFDTAGAEQFQSLTVNYYRSADGVMCCYDVTDRSSFDGCVKWIDSIERNSKSDIIKYVVGCKVDLQKQIDTAEGQAMAQRYKSEFMETSAYSGHGVKEVFEQIALAQVDKIIKQR